MHVVISAVSSARQPSGICRHAANLARCLSATREISRVTLLLGRWQLSYFLNAFDVGQTTGEVVPIDIENNPYARNRWYYSGLPRTARALRADIVQLSFPAPVRRALPCPLVCSLHDLYPYDVPRNFGYARVLFNRVFLRQCLVASSAIVCSSDFTLARLQRCQPKLAANKATRIYQSVSLDSHHDQEPTRLSLREQPFLLAVAQHRSNKNLDLLLSAYAEVRRRNAARDAKLVIVGAEGPETGKLRALVDKFALHQHVRFAADLSDAELCWLYRQCELLIAPSSVEGFCLPLAEALHCGTKVLCSDIPVLREVGGSACRYFALQSNDPIAALAQGIEDCLRDSSFQGEPSYRFSPAEIARQYTALYSSLLAGSCSPARAIEPPNTTPVTYDRFAS